MGNIQTSKTNQSGPKSPLERAMPMLQMPYWRGNNLTKQETLNYIIIITITITTNNINNNINININIIITITITITIIIIIIITILIILIITTTTIIILIIMLPKSPPSRKRYWFIESLLREKRYPERFPKGSTLWEFGETNALCSVNLGSICFEGSASLVFKPTTVNKCR